MMRWAHPRTFFFSHTALDFQTLKFPGEWDAPILYTARWGVLGNIRIPVAWISFNMAEALADRKGLCMLEKERRWVCHRKNKKRKKGLVKNFAHQSHQYLDIYMAY